MTNTHIPGGPRQTALVSSGWRAMPAGRMSAFSAEAGNMAYGTQVLGRVMESNANAALEDRVLFIRSGADLALLDARPLEFAKASMNDLEQN